METSKIKAVLNTVAILICGLSKFPQIRTNLLAKSTEGLSISGLFIDMISYSISVRYFVTNGYSWFDFLEFPMVMTQMVFLVTLSIVYTKKAHFKDVALTAATYLIFFFSIAPRSVIFPGPVILKLLLNMSTPLSVFGKFVYIRAIVSSGSGDLISRLPWFLNGTSSFIRIITVWMETADPNILIGSFLSVILNYVIIGVAIAYTPKHTKEKSDPDILTNESKKFN